VSHYCVVVWVDSWRICLRLVFGALCMAFHCGISGFATADVTLGRQLRLSAPLMREAELELELELEVEREQRAGATASRGVRQTASRRS
jgi:hypothetical protein